MKIFPIRNSNKPRLLIDKSIPEPELQYLNQARGVIENYLKDKKKVEQVSIINGDIFDKENIEMLHVYASRPTVQSCISFARDSATPFLRKVYKAVEVTVNDIIKKD